MFFAEFLLMALAPVAWWLLASALVRRADRRRRERGDRRATPRRSGRGRSGGS